jgi:Kelch motif
MGNFCTKKNKKTRNDIIEVRAIPNEEILYKPKISSNSIICYKPKNKAFWEEIVSNDNLFQNGCIYGLISSTCLLCVGGLEIGDFAVKISIDKKKISHISSPPWNLAYGFLHIYKDIAYIIGSITQTAEGVETGAPFIQYNLKSDKWELMPAPPLALVLPGSYIIESKIFVLGGFTSYPDSPTPFQSLLIYDIIGSGWSASAIRTPISNGMPNCITTPQGVLIVGGHDPFEHYSQESSDVFIFNGSQFKKCADLPEIGQLKFSEAGVYMNGEAHLYSEDELLFYYNVQSNTWKYVDLEDILRVNNEMPIIKVISGYGEYAYYYSQKDCDLVEYSITAQSTKTTGPSTFHKFPKYPGVGLLTDGRILIAGGIDEKTGIIKSSWILEPQLHQSININDLPCEQYGLNIIQISREIYAMSGINNSESICQKYNLNCERWEKLPGMPYYTFLPGCGYINGKIYCIGGCAEEEGASILYLVQVFCIKTEVWEVLNVEYPYGVLAPGVISVSNNKLLCFGGVCKGGYKVVNTYFFDGNRFSLVSELPDDDDPESTFFRDPCVINGNFVYAFGGNGKLYKFDMQEHFWTVEYPTTRI